MLLTGDDNMDKLKIYTASFYQVRNLQPNMIPFSTATGEPSWYHDNKDRNHVFIDKRGVYNGLIAEPFQFDKTLLSDVPCCKGCSLKPFTCSFMRAYRESIEKHSFDDIITYLSNKIEQVRETLDFKGEPIVILLVYEKPTCECAERPVIQQYFKDHGYEVTEWCPDIFYKQSLF